MIKSTAHRKKFPAALWKPRLCLLLAALLLISAGCTGCADKNFESYRPITDINNLEGRKIGINLGWSADYLLTGRDDMLLYRYDTTADMLVALCYKKLDAIALDCNTAAYVLAYTTGLQKVEPDLFTDSYLGLFAEDCGEACEEFNRWFADYQTTEEYANFADRYYNFDGLNYEWPFEEEITEGTPLRMATYSDAYPCAYYDLHLGTVGFEVEIFYAFCRDCGYKPVITPTTEDDVYMGILHGMYDCHFGAYSSLYAFEAEKYGYHLSDPYVELPIVFVEIADGDNLSISHAVDILDEDE